MSFTRWLQHNKPVSYIMYTLPFIGVVIRTNKTVLGEDSGVKRRLSIFMVALLLSSLFLNVLEAGIPRPQRMPQEFQCTMIPQKVWRSALRIYYPE